MRINLESNFMLLGSQDIDSIDFASSNITLKELLEAISNRATNSTKFLNRDGTGLAMSWEVEVNGHPLGLCAGGVNTILKDGDKVHIKLMLLGGG